jgi:[acyl-carrier-protein] S-malonyltransferase
VGQVLCALEALAAGAALKKRLPNRLIVAGYSVGEVAAWGVAGYLGLPAVLDLVARRAEAMDATSPSGDGMLFVRGLSREKVDKLCEEYGVAVAIVNPGDAFVLGGSRVSLHALADAAMAASAIRVLNVEVEVASHTGRLAPASALFRDDLRRMAAQVTIQPEIRLLSGIDAATVMSVDAGLEKLAAQISTTVQWGSCLEACIEAGATAFLELGPGSALQRMALEAYPNVPSRALDDFRTVDGVATWSERFSFNSSQ